MVGQVYVLGCYRWGEDFDSGNPYWNIWRCIIKSTAIKYSGRLPDLESDFLQKGYVMSSCRHLHLVLLPKAPHKLRCRHCHLTISADELKSGHCPECYEVHGRKNSDFEEISTFMDGKTRYRCEQCGVIIDADWNTSVRSDRNYSYYSMCDLAVLRARSFSLLSNHSEIFICSDCLLFDKTHYPQCSSVRSLRYRYNSDELPCVKSSWGRGIFQKQPRPSKWVGYSFDRRW